MLAALPAAAPAQSVQDVYRNLKSLEGRIPLPTPSAVVRVAGSFEPIFSEEIDHLVPRPTGQQRASFMHRTANYTVHVNAVNVGLRFESAPGAGNMRI